MRRIQPGMTLAEVETLLGGPASRTLDLDVEGMPAGRRAYRSLRVCQQASACVEVELTVDGCVTAAAGRGQPQPGILGQN